MARRPTLAVRLLTRRVRRSAGPPVDLELITIAFNNELVIRLQCDTFHRHISDRYHWTVADNSPSRSCRRALRSFCRDNGVAYLPLPRNPYTGRDPSRSHAEALNYVVRHYAGATGAPVLGLLDHDVFPTAPSSPVSRLGAAAAYGRERVEQGTRYLWPGLLFLSRSAVDVAGLDFRPGPPGSGADTGAGLAKSLFNSEAEHVIVLMSDRAFRLRSTDDEHYEMFDDWLHMVNASYWKTVSPKEADIVRLLQERAGLPRTLLGRPGHQFD